MSASNTPRINEIERRWKAERKISGPNVEWLIEQARAAETMLAADAIRRRQGESKLGDLLGGMFGDRR